MNKHPHFLLRRTNYPELDKDFDYVDGFMMKYKDGQLRLVGYDISIGTLVFVGLDRESKPIYKKVKEIKEERPSLGEFPNHQRPTSYRVSVE